MNYKIEMTYREEKGMSICDEGPVVIKSVEHYVIGGYVKCDRSLNMMAWGVTEKITMCNECFSAPVNTVSAPASAPVQLSLF